MEIQTSTRSPNDKTEILEAMKKRCEEQGHEWENCCSASFHIYKVCKWCGALR